MKKIVAIIILLAVMLPFSFDAPEAQAAETNIQGTIEEQIRAYVDSIVQKDVASTAAMAMALHGISGDGKTMYADEDNALSAVLINFELAWFVHAIVILLWENKAKSEIGRNALCQVLEVPEVAAAAEAVPVEDTEAVPVEDTEVVPEGSAGTEAPAVSVAVLCPHQDGLWAAGATADCTDTDRHHRTEAVAAAAALCRWSSVPPLSFSPLQC